MGGEEGGRLKARAGLSPVQRLRARQGRVGDMPPASSLRLTEWHVLRSLLVHVDYYGAPRLRLSVCSGAVINK